MTSRSLLSSLLLTGCATFATAQVDPSADTRQPLQNGLSSSSAQDAAISEDGGDFDQLTSGVRTVSYRVYVLNDLEYQSNATLDADSGESSFAWFPSVGAVATRRLADPFSVEAAAALQLGYFTDVSDQNFWGVDATVFLKYKPTSRVTVYAGPGFYDYEALYGDGDRLSRGVVPTLGATYERPLSDGRTVAFASARYQRHFTTPSTNDRDVWAGTLGLARKLTDTFQAQGFYEYRFSDYTTSQGSREDRRNTFGVALLYTPSASLRLRTSLTSAHNDSTLAAAEFETFNLGLGSTLTWQF